MTEARTQLTTTDQDVLRLTYGTLRWLLFLLPAVLFVVTVLNALTTRELETSISAYYGGPVRDVFVGVLMAVAACLVAYQGSTTFEDYTLNGAGFYAVFVALVPVQLEGILADLRQASVLAPDGVTPQEYIWALRFGLTTVVALCALLLWHEFRSTERVRRLVRQDRSSLVFVAVTAGTLLAFLSLAMWQLWVPPADEVTLDGIGLGSLPVVGEVRLTVHYLAAIFLICALAVAVWSHAWPHRVARVEDERPTADDMARRRGYQLIFWLMVAGPLVAAAIAQLFAPGHFVIFLEWWEIGLFCVFWVMETRRATQVPSGEAP